VLPLTGCNWYAVGRLSTEGVYFNGSENSFADLAKPNSIVRYTTDRGATWQRFVMPVGK
jgi:hypothetical protein